MAWQWSANLLAKRSRVQPLPGLGFAVLIMQLSFPLTLYLASMGLGETKAS